VALQQKRPRRFQPKQVQERYRPQQDPEETFQAAGEAKESA